MNRQSLKSHFIHKELCSLFFLLHLLSPVSSKAGLSEQHAAKGFDELFALQSDAVIPENHSFFEHHFATLPPPLLDEENNNQELSELSLFARMAHNRKKILCTLADYGLLSYFFYGLYQNYVLYYSSAHPHAIGQSWLQKSMTYAFPTILTHTPRHIGFFLTGTELLIQTYLIKLLFKMIIFCLL